MLTLRRFEELVGAYGADLQRWPEEFRADARALASGSAEARALLEEGAELDDAIDASRSHADGLRWRPGEREAALVRLRAGVAARIAAPTPTTAPTLTSALAPRPVARSLFPGWSAAMSRLGSPRLRFVRLATGAAFAIVVGLLLGATYESAPPPVGGVLTSLLQPAAIGTLAD